MINPLSQDPKRLVRNLYEQHQQQLDLLKIAQRQQSILADSILFPFETHGPHCLLAAERLQIQQTARTSDAYHWLLGSASGLTQQPSILLQVQNQQQQQLRQLQRQQQQRQLLEVALLQQQYQPENLSFADTTLTGSMAAAMAFRSPELLSSASHGSVVWQDGRRRRLREELRQVPS